jgi:hypothetical protein
MLCTQIYKTGLDVARFRRLRSTYENFAPFFLAVAGSAYGVFN